MGGHAIFHTDLNFKNDKLAKSVKFIYFGHLFDPDEPPECSDLPGIGIGGGTSTLDNVYDYYVLHINGFFIMPKRLNVELTSDETLFLHRLGRRCLCLGLNHIAEIYTIDTDKIIITLEAAGGSVWAGENG